jgi:UrcA family protein
MRTSILAFAAAMTFAFSLGVHADTSVEANRIISRGRSVVHYADLNIATEQGAKIMLQRIERAATKACGGRPTFSSYTGSLDNTFGECRDRAIQRAVKQLDAPMLTRIYAEARQRESQNSNLRATAGAGAGAAFDRSPPRFDRPPRLGRQPD